MKHKDITHPNLNNGKKTRVYFTVHEKEFDVFFREIYEEQHYVQGLDYLLSTGGAKWNKKGVLLESGFKKDLAVVDLGANVGLATLYFAPYVKKIYAFEPSPPVFEALKKNTEHLDNVEVFNEGVAALSQRLLMGSEQAGSLPQKIWYGDEKPKQQLCADFYDIKTLFEKHNIEHVDLLKIDIEDAEHEVFPSKEFGKVSKNIDAIVGEGHIIIGSDGKSLQTSPAFIPLMLEEWGYKTEFIDTKQVYFTWVQTYTDYHTKEKKEYKIPIPAAFFAKK